MGLSASLFIRTYSRITFIPGYVYITMLKMQWFTISVRTMDGYTESNLLVSASVLMCVQLWSVVTLFPKTGILWSFFSKPHKELAHPYS